MSDKNKEEHPLQYYYEKIIDIGVRKFWVSKEDATGLFHLANRDLRLWILFLELVSLGISVSRIHYLHLRGLPLKPNTFNS